MAIKLSHRKYDRHKDSILLDIYEQGAFNSSCRACLTDISIGGAGFEGAYRFNLGDKINLVFALKDGTEYVIESVVRRISRSTGTFLYGVEFVSVGFFKRFFLKSFINKLLID